MLPASALNSLARGVALRSWLAGGVAAALAFAVVGAATAEGAVPRRTGAATLVSVDGPARLTVKSTRGKLRIRLYLVDTPQAGECGAGESVAALAKLAKRRKGRLSYELLERSGGGFERDAEGRYLGFLSPRGRDGFFDGLGQDLVDTEWARYGESVGPEQRFIARDLQVGGVGAGGGPPRAPRGVWAQCGGRMHLAGGQPVPANAPAPWTITADGVTEAIGPLTLSPTLSPSTNLTIAQVAAVAPVEMLAVNAYECRAFVPSLQIVLSAATPGTQSCGSAEVYGVATSGPGAAPTTRGVGAGSPASAAKAAFPRLTGGADGPDPDGAALQLAGPESLPWAWQTVAFVDPRGTIDGLYTSAAPLGEDG